MAALIPVLGKETTTCSLMSYGYSPLISEWSPYHGAINAVVESVAKIIAMGGTWHTIRFSFQEFFEKLLNDPKRWGKPFSALLGAYRAQEELLLPSIGGKDSMSGSFEDLDVPPTLVSFAITGGDVHKVITPELKEAGHVLVEFMLPKDEFHVFDFEALRKQFDAVEALIQSGKAYSAYTVKDGGLVEAVYKMAFGNEIGVAFDDALTLNDLVENPNRTYIKSPAGIFTEAIFPIAEIYSEHKNDTLNGVNVSFTRYNEEESKYPMNIPQYVLMVRKQDMFSFFEENKITDNKTSFLSQYSSSNNTYTFTNIAPLITYCIEERKREIIASGGNPNKEEDWKKWESENPDWNKVVLIPVKVESNSNNEVVAISNSLDMESAALKGGTNEKNKLKMQIFYTTF